jgi:hypothetical protein
MLPFHAAIAFNRAPVAGYQFVLTRGVFTLRASRALAMPESVVTPALSISVMMAARFRALIVAFFVLRVRDGYGLGSVRRTTRLPDWPCSSKSCIQSTAPCKDASTKLLRNSRMKTMKTPPNKTPVVKPDELANASSGSGPRPGTNC